MDESTFWQLIDESRAKSGGDKQTQLELLRRQLEALPPEEVISFKQRLNEAMGRAYTWDLIGAAHFIGCGGSDDGFMDFRAWLVSLGHTMFDRIVQDPEILVEIPFDHDPLDEWEFEALHMLPFEICEEEESEDMLYDDDPKEPRGERCDESPESLKRRFPRLWERFGDKWMLHNR